MTTTLPPAPLTPPARPAAAPAPPAPPASRRTPAARPRHPLALPLVSAATTWVLMLSWRGFAVDWGGYLGPLMAVAVVVAVGGVVLRGSPLSRRVSAPLLLLVVVVLVWVMLGGVPWQPLSSTRELVDRYHDALRSASGYASPVPSHVPGIEPIMIPVGAAALLTVDYLACWLRRVPLAGLALLAVYCVPISLLGGGVAWLLFALTAVGFLLMMVLQETEHVARWGRPLGSAGSDSTGFGVNTGASRGTAASVGAIALVLAVVVPVFVPTMHLDGLGLFGPGGSGGGVKVVNPITDMRRDLVQGRDVPLLDIRTDDPDPSYLRIAVLTEFNGTEWSTGDRQIVSDQTADGLVPAEVPKLASDLPATPYNYTVHATNQFHSTWLPTAYPVTDIVARGDWHYDLGTMDFIAGNSSTDTAGLTYRMTSARPDLSAYSMVKSLNAPSSIQIPYTALPKTLPSYVSDLALKVTEGATSRFERARMLQDFFRSTGGFRYSIKRAPQATGNEALMQFLTPGKGHRVGYCEQFATAFAIMARSLSIPTRVAVGFLQPTKQANGEWVYTSHDLHAWPEVYFPGSGWVRFEPTPGQRAGSVPSYTVGAIKKPQTSEPSTKFPSKNVPTDASSQTAKDHDLGTTKTSTSSGGPRVPWVALAATLGGLLVLGLLALLPGLIRRRRRRRRLAGGVEQTWRELRDAAIDLGVAWPDGRSPRETADRLVGWFGPEPDGPPLQRPPRGPGLAPAAEAALDRVVGSLERVRYARRADDVPGSLAGDVETCIAALGHGATRRTLRRARWLPRSLVARRPAVVVQREREVAPVAAGGVVDHVG